MNHWKTMYVKFTKACVVAVALFAVSAVNSAHAESSITNVDSAAWLIMEGVKAYYKVYNEWPDCWSDVVDSQIVQVPLVAVSGEIIDPDDGRLDFAWDVQYVKPNGEVGPQLATMMTENGYQTKMSPISPVMSYSSEHANESSTDIQDVLNNELRLKQWAICGMLQNSVLLYKLKYDAQPVSFEELISSGVTGINECSINPLTDRVFYGDGRPNDFMFYARINDSTGKATANAIFAVDESGNTPWKFSY